MKINKVLLKSNKVEIAKIIKIAVTTVNVWPNKQDLIVDEFFI